MINLEKSIKTRYILFISTIILIIITALITLQFSVNTQKNIAILITQASKQCIVSERITNLIFSFDDRERSEIKSAEIDSLITLVSEYENSQKILISRNKESGHNNSIDSLLKISEVHLNSIVNSSRRIINNPELELIKDDIKVIAEAESPYFLTMQTVAGEYQKTANENLENLKEKIYFLSIFAVLILVCEFLFVLLPGLKQLLNKNSELVKTNNKLSTSENEISEKVLELSKLKTDLETKEAHNRIFIEQAPTAIAMLDNNMCYIAVSQRWVKDYKMEGQQIVGRSHYDIFPEIGDKWRLNHKKCLNGAIDTCDEAPFRRLDGSVQWIYWDVRPWYISEGNIGGLLMHTGDITHIKEKEDERIVIEKILDKTNEVARIGTWDINLIKNEIFWSKMVREIHEVPDNYKPNLEEAIDFFKQGKSKDTIVKAITEARENGTPYDVEVELITANNNSIWTRAIGQAEMVDGKCVRLLGVFQDINEIKISQIALNKAHNELKAIFNSGPIAIVSTDNVGIISHFNHGAETLLGYSATEMIGLHRPDIFQLDEEFEKFRLDIAFTYNLEPQDCDPYLELAKRDEYDIREWTYRKKDGSMFPVQLTQTAIKNDVGETIGFLGVAVDITERKRTENELLKKNQLLNFAEEITKIGHWKWDTVADKVQWSSNLFNIFELDDRVDSLTFASYFSFVHADDRTAVTDYFEKAATLKCLNNFTHRIIAGDGKLKTIQLLGEVISDSLGNVIEMIGTCQDVTEQKLAENKFRGLLESAPDAMVIVNESGQIQLINKQAEKLFGYSVDELFNKSVEILIPKRFLDNHVTHRDNFFLNAQIRKMGIGVGKELFGVNKEGTEIPIQISLSPLQTEEGLLVSAAIRDITEQKSTQNKIIEAKENLELLANKLKAQNTQLADFAHITSHNLRAPVSNLNSLLHFYNTSDDEEDKAYVFEKFEKVIFHLTHTLNTLVEAIKTKNGSSDSLEKISFDEVLLKTKEIISAKILKSDIQITSDFSKVESIFYNEVYMESIFLNLVDNAIKYSHSKRIPTIHIESVIENDKVLLKFKDNGLGIDLERHGHKLFGLNKVFHRHPDAKGVGLFMTKTQVEAMGGMIYAISKVDHGTTFVIDFQLR